MTNPILITGGTGKTGSRVAQQLQQLGHPVRIGSRHGQPAFDWGNPATYAPALRGAKMAYVVYYPDLAVPGAKEAIHTFTEAARAEGVEKLVLLSGKGEREAEACERIVAASGLRYTLVRASWFNQNFSESFLFEPVLAGQVALPMPEAAIPFVDAEDIAQVVVQALLYDEYDGETLEVTGPRKLTFGEAVAEIGRATGRSIAFEAISLENFRSGLREVGVPDDYVWLLGYLFEEVLGNPNNQTVSQDTERVLGRSATDFRAYAERVAASGRWRQPAEQPAV
ncbi:MAG: NmrA family NAD(P)-binding protein [Bacteroidota bacterium]